MRSVTKIFGALLIPAALGLGVGTMTGCSTAPSTTVAQQDLSMDAHTAFAEMKRADPTLDMWLQHAYAYAVFPSIAKGGAGAAGAYGRGEVYEQNRFIGYAGMTQGTIGAQVGGESYAELVVFQSKEALANFESNHLSIAADASAVALQSGAAANAAFSNGVVVFVRPNGGLMIEAAIGGQQFTYESAHNAEPQQAAAVDRNN